MASTNKMRTDWEQNWGSSIAVKITAPVLAVLTLVGLITTAIVQSNMEEEIVGHLSADADRIAFLASDYLIELEGGVPSEMAQLLSTATANTKFKFGEIQVGVRNIKFGQPVPGFVKTTVQVPYSHSKTNSGMLFADLTMYHSPIATIIRDLRKSLLVKIGVPFFLFGAGLAVLIHFLVTRPICDLVKATKAVSEGDISLRLNTDRRDEFGHLAEFFNQMLDRVETKQEELSEAVVAAEASSQAKSTFLANMSHEIRTPLTAIIGFSDMLKEGHIYADDTSHQIDSIIRAGGHLQEIINDILDLSKIEAGQLDIEVIDVSPIDLMKEVDDFISLRAADKGLNFKTEYLLPFPKSILTDPTRLKQILLNLLSNAVKFTNQGDVEVQVSFLKEEKKIRFDVTDNGIGMDEEEKQRIFRPFTQADTSTTRQYGGTGLGLCISKQLANKLGGDIYCESKKGLGSKFTLIISIGAVDNVVLAGCADLAEAKPKKEKFVLPTNSVSGNVLLAEDTPDNQRLISMYLRRTGVNPVIVENGQLALYKALDQDFDLILMDMQMPIMGGVEATAKLRSAGYKKPIVALTANALKEDREKCSKAGADDYLTKPLDLERFYRVLQTYLNTAQASTTASNAYVDEDLVNDPEYQALVDQFVEELPKKLSDINRAFGQKDWSALKSHVHKLKGTGSSFGFPVITEIATIIHKGLNNPQHLGLDERIDELNSNCDFIIKGRQRKAEGGNIS